MTKKQLYQVDWSRGQTDGDPVKGTVRRILNMDMDSFGKLSSRLPLVHGLQEFARYGRCAFISHTVTGTTYSGWMGFVVENGIRMLPFNGITPHEAGSQLVRLEGLGRSGEPLLSITETQIVTYGDKIFVNAVDENGERAGMFMIMDPDTSGRFMAPKQCADTELDGEEAGAALGWISFSTESRRPVLSVKPVISYGFDDGDKYDPYPPPMNRFDRSHEHRTGISMLAQMMADDDEHGVGIIAFMTAVDDLGLAMDVNGSVQTDYQPAPMFGRRAVVEYRVQYVFYGGQTSRVSNPVNVTWEDETELDAEPLGFMIGLVPMIPRNIDPAVRGMHIYRKIIDSGNEDLDNDSEFMLVKTVWLDSDMIDEENQDINEISIDRANAMNEGYHFLWGNNNDDIESKFSSYCWIEDRWRIPQVIRSVYASNAEAWRTSGWMRWGANYLVHADFHFGSNCEMKVEDIIENSYVNSGGVGPAEHCQVQRATMEFEAMLFSRINRSSSREMSVIRGGADMPSYSLQSGSSPYYGMWTRYRTGEAEVRSGSLRNTGGGIPQDAFAIYKLNGPVTVSHESTIPLTAQYQNFYDTSIPLVGFRDTGAVTPDTESSIVGAEDEDLIKILPEAIAVSGGRLLGIGGTHDGSQQNSRMAYSFFQRFGFFTDNNFFDYGARDDGIGIAISTFRGRVILHFTSSTFIIDVSGGSDMSWRELGADTGIGIANKRAVASTPAGSIWGDRNGVYIFDGSSISEITYMERIGVDVRETYEAMIQDRLDDLRVFYVRDTKQAWITCGKDVMVFDITTGAWHEHDLTELVEQISTGFEILSVDDIDNTSVFTIRDAYGVVRFFTRSEDHSEATMDWGIDVEMTLGAQEVIKKSKRLYVDIATEVDGANMTADVSAQGGGIITQDLSVVNVPDMYDPDVDSVIRFSASARGRRINISLRKKEGESWSGVIESLGVSHKVKAIK